jgi:hypothetical protein
MSIPTSVPAHAYYGRPVDGQRPAGQTSGSRLAAPSAPYLGRGNKCTAKEDTCEGNRVSGEMLCAGHLRSYNKALSKAIAAEEAEGDDS